MKQIYYNKIVHLEHIKLNLAVKSKIQVGIPLTNAQLHQSPTPQTITPFTQYIPPPTIPLTIFQTPHPISHPLNILLLF